MVLGVAGGYILTGSRFLLSLLGLFAGSMLAAALARRFGQPLVLRFVGRETYSRLAPADAWRGLLVSDRVSPPSADDAPAVTAC